MVKVAGVYESLPADSGSVFVRVSRLLNTARFQDCRLLLSRRFDLSPDSLRGLYDDASALARVLLATTVAIEVLAASAARESAGAREIRPRGHAVAAQPSPHLHASRCGSRRPTHTYFSHLSRNSYAAALILEGNSCPASG